MGDVVERLRALGQKIMHEPASLVMDEAATELETLRARAEKAEKMAEALRGEVTKNKAVDCPINKVGGAAHKICPDCRATASMICRNKAEAAFGTVRCIVTALTEWENSDD